VNSVDAAVAFAEQALGARVVRAKRHPYTTSHPLVDVDLEQGDGTMVAAIVKETSVLPWRPRFVQRTDREAGVYRLLQPSGVWAPRLLAASTTHLLIERSEGQPLWELETEAVAARLGAVLRATHDALARDTKAPFLLRYDDTFYRRWFRRATAATRGLSSLAPTYEIAVKRLLDEPVVVVHGELYPSNALIDGEEVLFIDWECAGAGPAVVDVAAVTTGWRGPELKAFLDAYGPVDHHALECARLHLAVRWLGWSTEWRPPAEHARDWKSEALNSASRVRSTLAA
jgi:aminoglycoside phosphotransferase (APT) family kinase protein